LSFHDNTFRMRIDLEITDKALGNVMPDERYRIQQKVSARMMAAGRRAMYEELGIPEPRGNTLEHEAETFALEHHGPPS
jgi:hypothetical protein